MRLQKCSTRHCDEPAVGSYKDKPMCELCLEGWDEYHSSLDGPDPHGDRDPTPEQQAGWAFEDKLEMYRNEY